MIKPNDQAELTKVERSKKEKNHNL